jgi:integrase
VVKKRAFQLLAETEKHMARHEKKRHAANLTKAELQKLLKDSSGMLRCFLLLFCNCGFRKGDVVALTHSMYDGKYITRTRPMTNTTNAWLLWKETIEAIEQHQSKSGELLFVQDNGDPWVIEKLNSGNLKSRDDAFRRKLWLPFVLKHNVSSRFDLIRSSCARLLETDSERTNQSSVQIKYLGQSARGVALRCYTDPPQSDLDAAIMSLRKMLIE